MLFVERITRLVELVIVSPKVQQEIADAVIANLALVAQSGSGKSRILRMFSAYYGVLKITNTSYDQIVKSIFPRIEKKEVTTLLFPEFNKILARKEATMLSSLGILNPLIDEGIDSIEMPNVNIVFNPPLKCSEALAVSSDIFNKYLINWTEIGFAQRHLFESWCYTRKQINQICDYIEEQRHYKEKVFGKNFKKTEIYLDKKFAKVVRPLAFRLIEDLQSYVNKACMGSGAPLLYPKDQQPLPFRYLKQLHLLLKANALVEERDEVNFDDVRTLCDISKCMNLQFNRLEK
jgi:hypothetical protein